MFESPIDVDSIYEDEFENCDGKNVFKVDNFEHPKTTLGSPYYHKDCPKGMHYPLLSLEIFGDSL